MATGQSSDSVKSQLTRCVHVGDLHFWRFTKNPLRMINKRFMGIGNLALRRARIFRQELAPFLSEKIQQLDPDWYLFSGDLTTTSLRKEFEAASEFLQPYLDSKPDSVLYVPGNHDRYTLRDHRKFHLETHLTWLGKDFKWPYAKEISEGVHVIGLDATTPNGMGSFGKVDEQEFRFIEEYWEKNRSSIKSLVLLCHFPPEAPIELIKHDRGVQLKGGMKLLKLLKKLEVPVYYLHGHHHFRWIWRSPIAENVVYLNAGAPLMRRSDHYPDMGFYELSFKTELPEITLYTTKSPATKTWNEHNVEIPNDHKAVCLQHLS